MQASVYGPAVLFQECWKRQSLQQTLLILIITMGRIKELLDLSEFCDAVLLKKATPKARRATTYFKSQVIELFLILQTSDTQMVVDGNGLTSLGSRAYLMNVLPHALARAFCLYVRLDHGYYASAYYNEVPLDWIAKSRRVICLTTMINGNAFCQGTAHDVTRRLMECPAIQLFGCLRTTNQIKMNLSKRYRTRNLKNNGDDLDDWDPGATVVSVGGSSAEMQADATADEAMEITFAVEEIRPTPPTESAVSAEVEVPRAPAPDETVVDEKMQGPSASSDATPVTRISPRKAELQALAAVKPPVGKIKTQEIDCPIVK